MTPVDINQLAQQVSEKKRYLSRLAALPMMEIAHRSLDIINSADLLDEHLLNSLKELPYCTLIYITNWQYEQVSSNVTPSSINKNYRQQDLSERPYLQQTIPLKGMVISDIYTDGVSQQSCITLTQGIHKKGRLVGLVIADFNLDELPTLNETTRMISNLHQFKGDPAIRGSIFSQQRSTSRLDPHIDLVHSLLKTLVLNHGVFHFKLHYSSSRVTLWLHDEPHHYKLHSIDDLLSEKIFSLYPEKIYPEEICVNTQMLDTVLRHFKSLRFADDNIYLRSGSINIINCMIGLNFSCDGSHYIPVPEFIDNSIEYWLGSIN